MSLYRQRVILTVRWWFRLPIDDIKDQEIKGLIEINKKSAETIQTVVRVLNQMQARLQLYEKNIPRMRALKEQYERDQVTQRARAEAASADLSNGVLPIESRMSAHNMLHPDQPFGPPNNGHLA